MPNFTLDEWYTLVQDKRRAENVARELASLVRKDATLFAKVKARTKRWIKKQDLIALQKLDAKDAALLHIKKKEAALAKLSKEDQIALGIYNPPIDD